MRVDWHRIFLAQIPFVIDANDAYWGNCSCDMMTLSFL